MCRKRGQRSAHGVASWRCSLRRELLLRSFHGVQLAPAAFLWQRGANVAQIHALQLQPGHCLGKRLFRLHSKLFDVFSHRGVESILRDYASRSLGRHGAGQPTRRDGSKDV